MGLEQHAIRILWGSPLPPIRSGVADYAAELLVEVSKLAEVRILRPPGWSSAGTWFDALDTVPADTQADPGEILLIHLGNNPHHLWLADRSSSEPLAVVLHDVTLHHLLTEATEAAGDHEGYRRGVIAAHGRAGAALAEAREHGIHGRLDPFIFPARKVFLQRAGAVVVHSAWAQEQLRQEGLEAAVGRIGLAVADPGPVDRRAERAKLGLDPEDVAMMHLGFLTPEKGMAEIVEGLAAALRAGISARLVVAGEGEGLTALKNAAAAVGIAERVTTTGWVAAGDFPRIPAAADLGVVYRTPSAGETSAAAIRFLACGTPVAVGGLRQFLEWPEPAAPRLTPGPSAASELARCLSMVGSDTWPGRRSAARRTYEECHRPATAARALVAFLTSVFGHGKAAERS